MNVVSVVLFSFLYGILVLIIQRSEQRRRQVVALILIAPMILLHALANARGVGSESTAGVVLALVLNFLFWLLIGRYNPVGSSDDIHVIGMDD